MMNGHGKSDRRVGPAKKPALSPLLILGVILLLCSSLASAAQVTFTWDDLNNDPAEVGGYLLYYWQPEWETPDRIDLGLQTTYTLTSLEAGQTYAFAVTAYDNQGDRESSFSNVFSTTLPLANASRHHCDFDNDGKCDILLQHDTTQQTALWFMDAATVMYGQFLVPVPDADWEIMGVGDVDADGDPDIVLRNHASNRNAIWFMNGVKVEGGAFLSIDPPVN